MDTALTLLREARELGYYWGPPLIVLALFAGLVWSRWKRRYRKPRSLFWNWETFGLAIASTVGLALFYHYWGIPAPFEEGEIGFLIAQVPADKEERSEQSTYEQAIIRAAENSDLAGIIKVRLLGRPLPRPLDEQHAVALALARRLKASFVLRFVRVVEGHVPWLTIVAPPEPTKTSIQLENISFSQLAQLHEAQLPNDMILVARCALAFSFLSQNKYEQANRAFEKILSEVELPAAAPSRPVLQFAYAFSLLKQETQEAVDRAIGELQKALELKPDFPDAWNNLGVALRAKGQSNEAIAAYRKALALKPDYNEALSNLGIALRANGETDEAIAAYRKALMLKPHDAVTLSNLGVALRHNGQINEAIAVYRKALALKPDNPEVLYNLGNALAAKGQTDEAIAAYKQALLLKPEFPLALNNLGNTFAVKGQYEEAIREFHKAITIQPGSWQFHVNLGRALRKLGREEEAEVAFAEAKRLNPRFEIPSPEE